MWFILLAFILIIASERGRLSVVMGISKLLSTFGNLVASGWLFVVFAIWYKFHIIK